MTLSKFNQSKEIECIKISKVTSPKIPPFKDYILSEKMKSHGCGVPKKSESELQRATTCWRFIPASCEMESCISELICSAHKYMELPKCCSHSCGFLTLQASHRRPCFGQCSDDRTVHPKSGAAVTPAAVLRAFSSLFSSSTFMSFT
eukprot:c18700_g2_i1 orf=41-481(+)